MGERVGGGEGWGGIASVPGRELKCKLIAVVQGTACSPVPEIADKSQTNPLTEQISALANLVMHWQEEFITRCKLY